MIEHDIDPDHPRSFLTIAQKRVLEHITHSIQERGYAPSYREIMQELGYKSPGAVHRIIRALQEKGYIHISQSQAWRTLAPVSVVQEAKTSSNRREEQIDNSLFSLEIIGSLIGSKPPELMMSSQSITLPKKLFLERNGGRVDDLESYQPALYGLIIQDSSFLGEHLLPGDIIIIEPMEDDIKPGDLVLASTPSETIIGHFFNEGEMFRFKSNPYSDLTPLHQGKKRQAIETQIWGVILGSLRGFSFLVNL